MASKATKKMMAKNAKFLKRGKEIGLSEKQFDGKWCFGKRFMFPTSRESYTCRIILENKRESDDVFTCLVL